MLKALKAVCTFSVTSRSFSPSDSSLNYYIHRILCYELEENIKITFKMFMGQAALAERLFDPSYMESWWENEQRLEADYTTYLTLRERQVQLKSRSEQREREHVHQQSLCHNDTSKLEELHTIYMHTGISMGLR
ncbi:hypothetical protein EB796_000570 [Bugula neritina]|uniref:Uncharacterized protein n=1 Tax=Bugula neritina TaxID=10212 RepID=A0A7J7KSP6_BUGNE|nr:hypothetical protein EB796_000570 [Bugula neritina]